MFKSKQNNKLLNKHKGVVLPFFKNLEAKKLKDTSKAVGDVTSSLQSSKTVTSVYKKSTSFYRSGIRRGFFNKQKKRAKRGVFLKLAFINFFCLPKFFSFKQKKFIKKRIRFFIKKFKTKIIKQFKFSRVSYYYFFRKFRGIVSLKYPRILWVRKRPKFSFYKSIFVKKQYTLFFTKKKKQQVLVSRRKKKVFVFKNYRKLCWNLVNRRFLKKIKRKFLFFFKRKGLKRINSRMLINLLSYCLNLKYYKRRPTLILLRFFFYKLVYQRLLHRTLKKFKLFLKRFTVFRRRRRRSKAFRRYRVRFLRRRSKSYLGVRLKFLTKQRFFVKRLALSARQGVLLTKERVWIKQPRSQQNFSTRKGYWKNVQQRTPALFTNLKVYWQLSRFIKKSFFMKNVSRRRWQSAIWLWRSKENRRRLRDIFKLSQFNKNCISFLKFHSTYFSKVSVFSTIYFAKQKLHVGLTTSLFELDCYKFFVLNYLNVCSMLSISLTELSLVPTNWFFLLIVSKNKFLTFANQSKGSVSFLVAYLLHKKQQTTGTLFSKITQLRFQVKKVRIALLKRNSLFVKIRKKIITKRLFKSWFKFLQWRNWRRRFSPLLFKTLFTIKPFFLTNHLLVLFSNLRFFSNRASLVGGFLKKFSETSSKKYGFSFINRWLYRYLGKVVKFPYQQRTYKKLKNLFFKKRYSLTKANPLVLKSRYKKKYKINKKELLSAATQKPYTSLFKHSAYMRRFLKFKKKNLLYKFFSLRIGVGLFKTRRTVWSSFAIKSIQKKYKQRLYNRVLQKVPFYERMYFRPWSRKWWFYYNKRLVETKASATVFSTYDAGVGVFVKITLNNVFVGLADEDGNPFTVWSAGSVGFKGPTKKTTTAVDLLLSEVFNFAQKVGFDTFKIIFASSPANFLAKRFLGSFIQPFTSIYSVSFCGKLPHNGVRMQRQKRR